MYITGVMESGQIKQREVVLGTLKKEKGKKTHQKRNAVF